MLYGPRSQMLAKVTGVTTIPGNVADSLLRGGATTETVRGLGFVRYCSASRERGSYVRAIDARIFWHTPRK